uniref:Cyclin-dependent protein kinase inhibitor SMR3-like n=1 Tax=Bursaphelenchus xylophilus TaxID=6326 RepID=A0A1I7SAI5_BURXY
MASNSSSIVVMIPEPVKNAKAEPFPARTFKRNSKPRRKDKKCLRIEAILRNAEEMEEINFLERILAPTLGSGAGADPKISGSGSGSRLGAGAAQSRSQEPAPEPWQSLVIARFCSAGTSLFNDPGRCISSSVSHACR